MTAFVTGSHAYGTPREDSDLDLVVLVSPADLAILNAVLGTPPPEGVSKTEVSTSFKIGSVDLITFVDAPAFEAWRGANQALIARKPVTRETAVTEIKAALEKTKAKETAHGF